LGYPDHEAHSLHWLAYPEPDLGICWYKWKDQASLWIGESGCCLEAAILWSAFVSDPKVCSAIRALVKAIAGCFSADTAIYSPDSSVLYNAQASRIQSGESFLKVIDSIRDTARNFPPSLNETLAASGMDMGEIVFIDRWSEADLSVTH
jgi:hypothetical protein